MGEEKKMIELYHSRGLLIEKFVLFVTGALALFASFMGILGFCFYKSYQELGFVVLVCCIIIIAFFGPVFVLTSKSLIELYVYTTKYDVHFYMNEFVLVVKKTVLHIDYQKVESVAWKRPRNYIGKLKGLYLEIECGLSSPVYVYFSPVSNVEQIGNIHFQECYAKIANNTGRIEKRNKVIQFNV